MQTFEPAPIESATDGYGPSSNTNRQEQISSDPFTSKEVESSITHEKQMVYQEKKSGSKYLQQKKGSTNPMMSNNADLANMKIASTRTPKSFVVLPKQSAIDHTDDDYITSDVQPSGVEDFTENEGWNDSEEEEAMLERNDALLEKMAK